MKTAALEKNPSEMSSAPSDHSISRSNAPTNAALISPLIDNLMIGGASIFVFLLYWLYVEKTASTTAIAFTAGYLSFVVNWPHFLSSYQLMYGDYRKNILAKSSFFWAAVVSPLLIIGVLLYGIMAKNTTTLALMAQAMYLSVGWHYVKQIFGVAIVTSAAQKRYFGKWERVFILLNLYSVWAMSWVSANIGVNKNDMDGISYYSLGLPPYAQTVTYWMTGLTFVAAAFVLIQKYIKTGIKPAAASMVAFASIYIWFVPALDHPSFTYLVPFFHSLQYMLFVTTLKKNSAKAEAAGASDEVAQRSQFVKSFFGFFALATILGMITFKYLPEFLDKNLAFEALVFGPTMWMFAFMIFINLHHYFIDNVIWRGDNPALKNHLVGASINNYSKVEKSGVS